MSTSDLFSIEDGVLEYFNNNDTASIPETLKIPNSVTILQGRICSDKIKDIILSNQLKYIKEYTLSGLGITHITIPKSVIRIGRGAFRSCIQLKSCDMQANITELPTQLFSNCTAIEEINLPQSLVTIDREVFENCNNLKVLELPTNLRRFNACAFSGAPQELTVIVGQNTNVYSDWISSNLDGVVCTFSVVSGSPVEQWCKENNLNYIVRNA